MLYYNCWHSTRDHHLLSTNIMDCISLGMGRFACNIVPLDTFSFLLSAGFFLRAILIAFTQVFGDVQLALMIV